MNNQNPATPASAAIPGTNEPGNNQEKVVTPAPSTIEGKEQPVEGKIVIDKKEYANLQRNSARLQSRQKRDNLMKGKKSTDEAKNFDNADPDVVEELQQTTVKLSSTEQELFEERLGNRTRDLLAKNEFKNLPESTKKLILKNPSSLSKAESIEEAILDIEDFVTEEVSAIGVVQPQTGQPQVEGEQINSPQGHETPPVINAGSPAIPDQDGLEDVSKLNGVEKTRTMIRNSMKKATGKIS